ncbi:uncharacterized protein LOC111296574 [Durio zibethinus]|uniref:Uncharacterized protein LOC111296574 n=1 Tax=Durio zibethinus TaxID=66656 RepID=A0A6P5Z2Z7_DURZI|nr:uncharacterized protein LOC111296574 [Durio zibethinus]
MASLGGIIMLLRRRQRTLHQLMSRKRGCNAVNYCRGFTLSVENRSGTRVEAVAIVKAGAPLNSSAAGTEAIATGIASWSLNKTKSGMLSVSINATAGADSAQMLQLKAVSRGIARMGLAVQYRSASMSSENMSSLHPVDGSITITVDATSNQVDLKFLTQVKKFGETDIIQILEYAKTILPAIQK